MMPQTGIAHMSATRLILPLFLLLAALAVVPADAASSKPTASASGVLAVYDQPYGPFRHLLFKLADNERVYVLQCTREARRCEIETLDGDGRGWVDGSYLYGAPAKNAVTPFEFSFDPMDPMDLFNHRRHH
jgi:hypothetical protein